MWHQGANPAISQRSLKIKFTGIKSSKVSGEPFEREKFHDSIGIPKNARLCHKHFIDSDYVTERTYKQSRRKNKKGNLRQRTLNIFRPTSQDNHLHLEITALASSDIRRQLQDDMSKSLETSSRERDEIKSFEDLHDKLATLNLLSDISVGR